MTAPVKPGDRVQFHDRWTATVSKVRQNGTHWDIWLCGYSTDANIDTDDDLDDESIWWWNGGFVVIGEPAPPGYPRYATLDEIPIEPGCVEWQSWGEPGYSVYGLTSASRARVYASAESSEFRDGATIGRVIQDFWTALCGESDRDRAWLRERYHHVVCGYRSGGWCARIVGLCAVAGRETEADAYAALRRAVEAIESEET